MAAYGHDDPDYRYLEQLKEAKTRGSGEDDEGGGFQSVADISTEALNDETARLYKSGITQSKMANLFEFDQSTGPVSSIAEAAVFGGCVARLANMD